MTSVVVPVYNGADVLPTTLPALLALEDVDEVVVVDDGSTDDTPLLLYSILSHRTQLHVETLPSNRGRAAARNAGIAIARGDVLVLFDADVEPPPHAARALADASRRPGAIASVARIAPMLADPSEPFQDYVGHHPRGPAPSARPHDVLDWRFFLSGACAVRREAMEAAGGFLESVPYGEDVVLGCRLAEQAPDGLRLADATVRLHDLGDLDRAVENARLFGAAAGRLDEPCRGGGLDALRRAHRLSGAAALAAPVLRRVVSVLGPGSFRRKAVRYLLASTALRAARRA